MEADHHRIALVTHHLVSTTGMMAAAGIAVEEDIVVPTEGIRCITTMAATVPIINKTNLPTREE